MPPRTVREMRPRARRALIRAQKKEEQKASPPDKKKANGDEIVVQPIPVLHRDGCRSSG